MERRNFLSGAAAILAGAGLSACGGGGGSGPGPSTGQPPVNAGPVTPPVDPAPAEKQTLVTQLWSRHLQWVATQTETQQGNDPYGIGVEVGEALLEAGYAAVDLTVRNDGHVHPANVGTHLPAMLKGIRSTGAICDHIGVNIAPPADANDTAWIASQFVHEILSVAGENGIRRYRFNNSGAATFPANTYGEAMTAVLDGVRANHERLAAINAQYGKLCGVAHTHGNNIGTSVYDYAYSMRDIDPKLIGINLAIGHTANAVVGGVAWEMQLRRNIERIKCTAVEDLRATVNATTGALSAGRVEPIPGTPGGGVIDWKKFYTHLLKGGYSGAAESQIEYSIPDSQGNPISLNSAFWADSAAFAQGRLTRALMIASLKKASGCILEQAAAAGWGQNDTLLL